MAKKAKNICACLNEAKKELNEEDINNATGKIDEDFLDEWQDIAGKTNTDYAQKLWGRILKTEICQPNSISIRALRILRNMSKLEAEAFTRVITYTINGVILDDDYKILTPNELQMLHDAGLFASSIPLSNNTPITKDYIALKGLNWGYLVTFNKEKLSNHNKFVISGPILTQTAKSLLQIPDSQMIDNNKLITIYSLLKKENNFIQQISVHPMLDENQFNPHITICAYGE